MGLLNYIYMIIIEEKNLGTLYHSIDAENLRYILASDKIGSLYGESIVSLTRSIRYTTIIGMDKLYSYKIILDGDKLSYKYKIRSVAEQGPFVSGNRFEAEERLYGTIKEAHKYILGIAVTNLNFANDKSLNTLLRHYCENYSIPIYIQKKSQFVRDEFILDKLGLIKKEYKLKPGIYDINLKPLYLIKNNFKIEQEIYDWLVRNKRIDAEEMIGGQIIDFVFSIKETEFILVMSNINTYDVYSANKNIKKILKKHNIEDFYIVDIDSYFNQYKDYENE